jgi:predicted TIM-barrel fold metal-dependent hydrolase
MGGYECWDDVERYLVGRDLYFDTSYSLADLGPERMAALMRMHGIDRVLFATDSPWTDQASELAAIRALSLSDDEIAAVLGGNAARLLLDR